MQNEKAFSQNAKHEAFCNADVTRLRQKGQVHLFQAFDFK